MAKLATRPDFFANFESLKRNLEAKKKKVTPEEQALYSMSLTEGWKLFNNRIERLLKEMDQLNDQAISSGASLDEIGRNTVVMSLAKSVIKKLVSTVDDAREACEKPKKGQNRKD